MLASREVSFEVCHIQVQAKDVGLVAVLDVVDGRVVTVQATHRNRSDLEQNIAKKS